MYKTIKRIWNSVTTVLVALMLLLAGLLWGVRLVGLNVFVVQSGSMEPEYRTGSLVYVQQVDPTELQVGDVITFNLGGGVRGTHRIIEILDENGELRFRTKGDANDYPDNGYVLPGDIVGQVRFTIPYLGYFVAYIQQPPGTYAAISAAAVILLLIILPDLIFTDKTKKTEETQ